MKKKISKLEREISIKIHENQMKQHNGAEEKNIEAKENIGIKLEAKGIKSLLPKR